MQGFGTLATIKTRSVVSRQAASPVRSIIFQRCNPAERFGQGSPVECDVNDRCAYSISGQIPATLIYGSSVDRPALPLYKTIPRRLVDRERQRGKLVETTIIKLGLRARAYSRVLKVGRTIPISAGIDEIQPAHIAKAIQYRSLDRRL